MPGVATRAMLGFPGRFTFPEYLGVAFLIVAISYYWGRFVNKMV